MRLESEPDIIIAIVTTLIVCDLLAYKVGMRREICITELPGEQALCATRWEACRPPDTCAPWVGSFHLQTFRCVERPLGKDRPGGPASTPT